MPKDKKAETAPKKTDKKITPEQIYKNELDRLTDTGPLSMLIEVVTNHYLSKPDAKTISAGKLAGKLLQKLNGLIDDHNIMNPKSKWKALQDLTPQQIASCMARRNYVALLKMTDSGGSDDNDILAIYQTRGSGEGTYTVDTDAFAAIARGYNYGLSRNDLKEVSSALRTMVPHVSRNKNEDYIPVENGIWDYRNNKWVMDEDNSYRRIKDAKGRITKFSPDLVFISKSHVKLRLNAKQPKLRLHGEPASHPWTIEDWMKSLSDDPGVVHLLWQICGAIIRPNVPWDQSAWLYSTRGNNGKGTLCELMRNLCGPGSYTKIALHEFGEDFMLEPLLHVSAIITDENDVGTYIDKGANLKAIETGDVISINRKFKSPVDYQFRGFMVQCLNEMPKSKDQSESFYRRQIFIPMLKNFQGHEKKYIKQEYLKRQDVLEYALCKLLYRDPKYYKLDVPESCNSLMNEYKEYNDPIKQFIDDIIPQCQWDLLPFAFLYDLYRPWFRQNIPNGKAVSKRAFVRKLHEFFNSNVVNGFTCDGRGQERTGNKMSKPEPLILQYNLTNWMNRSASGSDLRRREQPNNLAARYNGLIRVEQEAVA